jgi:cytochrome c peroxidase
VSVLPKTGYLDRCFKRNYSAALLIFVGTLLLIPSSQADIPAVISGQNSHFSFSNEPLVPLPVLPAVDAARRAMGQRLFFDQRLSDDDQHSCASCHRLPPIDPDQAGRSVMGAELKGEHKRDMTLLYNVSQLYWLDWDGRYSTLEALIEDAVTDVDKLNSGWPELITELTPFYQTQSEQVYGTDLTKSVVKDALATFLRSLNAAGAAFDRYLSGDPDALSERQQQGYALFKRIGCSSCHNGKNIGGNLFEQLYIYRHSYVDRHQGSTRPNPPLKDLGRYYVTGEEPDRNSFRVSPLRNVALTAPYFHDGSVATLDEAVERMAEYQLGLTLSSADTALIVEFLHSLTGFHAGVLAEFNESGGGER